MTVNFKNGRKFYKLERNFSDRLKNGGGGGGMTTVFLE